MSLKVQAIRLKIKRAFIKEISKEPMTIPRRKAVFGEQEWMLVTQENQDSAELGGQGRYLSGRHRHLQ